MHGAARDSSTSHEHHRHIGAIGQRKTPGKVWKGKHLPGHYGVDNITVQNLTVVGIEAETNVLLVKGAVPGHADGHPLRQHGGQGAAAGEAGAGRARARQAEGLALPGRTLGHERRLGLPRRRSRVCSDTSDRGERRRTCRSTAGCAAPTIPDSMRAPSESSNSRSSVTMVERWPSWAAPALVAAVATATFAMALRGGFVWDDLAFLPPGRRLLAVSDLRVLFTTGIWSFSNVGIGEVPVFRPIAALLLRALAPWFGANPLPWHVVPIALHASNSALAYGLARRLEPDAPRVAALAGALLFAVLPCHVEAVAWIMAFPHPLAALFALVAFHAQVTHVGGAARLVRRGRNRHARCGALVRGGNSCGAGAVPLRVGGEEVASPMVRMARLRLRHGRCRGAACQRARGRAPLRAHRAGHLAGARLRGGLSA